MDEIEDLDDSIVEDIIKVLEQKKTNRKKGTNLLAVQQAKSSSGRFLDESMDISNLNVSFNSAAARTSRPSTAKQLAKEGGKSNTSQQLVKSFGPPCHNFPPPAKNESGNTPRSSMMYQESDNYEDEKFDSESEESHKGATDAESIAEEISSEVK